MENKNDFINPDNNKSKKISFNNTVPVKIPNLNHNEQKECDPTDKGRTNISDIILELDLKGKIVFANPQVYAFAGYQPEELIGKNVFKFIKMEDISKIQEVIQKAEISEIFLTMEGIVLHKNGSHIPVSARGKVYKVGGELRHLVILRDVTQQREHEKKIKEYDTRFRLISENANDLIAILDEDFNYEYINDHYEQVLGYSYNELYTMKPIHIVHPDDLKLALNTTRLGIKNGTASADLRYRHKKGHFLWFEMKGTFFKDIQGHFKSLLISRDITERIIAQQRLHESEEKYRLISENTDDLIVVFNEKFQIEYVNELAHSRLLGYLPNKFKDTSFRISLIHPEDLKRSNQLFKEKLLEGKYKNQLRLKHEHGDYIWFEVKAKTYIDGMGNKKIIFVSRDITELKKSEEKLKELNNLKTELLRRTSHELKTPLTAICGATELLSTLYAQNLDLQPKNMVDIIKKGGDRLKKLVNDLLDITQLEAKKINLKKENVNVAAILNECIDEVKIFADERNLFLEFQYEKDVYLKVDRLRFEQVIFNLLYNAIKYTPPLGTVAIIIDEFSENYIDIIIEDTGIGLTAEETSKIFTLFGKVERQDTGLNINTEGTGLGLFISKEIIELHGGKIWVESPGRNKGSKFIVRLLKN